MYDVFSKHISYTQHLISQLTGRWKDYVQSKIKNLKKS